MHLSTAAAVLFSLLVLSGRVLHAAPEVLDHSVWDRYLDSLYECDQAQTRTGLLAGNQIGQTFRAQADRLDRLDLITKNRTDLSPGRVRLFQWRTDYETTVSAAPLWEELLDFSGQDAPVLRHCFPEIALTPGTVYYIDCTRDADWFYMAGIKQDSYADGHAVVAGKAQHEMDLWFRTHSKRVAQSALPMRPLPDMPDTKASEPDATGPAVNRQLYLDAVRGRFAMHLAGGWQRNPGKYIHQLMFYSGFLAKHTGDPHWVEPIPGFLKEAERFYFETHPERIPTFRFVSQFAHGMRWLDDAGKLTESERVLCRRILLEIGRRSWGQRERGAMNRGAFKGFMYAILADLYPDVPEAAAWREFSETVWRDWAEVVDTDEDSAHYNAVWLDAMLPWIGWRKNEAIYRTPEMIALAARFRDILTPQGGMPSWGDSILLGADWGAWAAFFETMATHSGDRTFKWAAQNVIRHHCRYILDEKPLLAGYEDHPNLVWAYLSADDDLAPSPPEFGSAVLTAAHAVRLTKKRRVEEHLPWYQLTQERTPWKLLFRDGDDRDAWYALFGLRPWGGHGHADAPALLCLSARGTVSMHDSAYFDKRWEDHNLLYGIHVAGGRLGPEPDRTDVAAFAVTPVADYADIAWLDYPGRQMVFGREVLFIKGLGWWVRDRTGATQPAVWFLGPIWHLDRLLSRGPNWFLADYPAPTSFRWALANGGDPLLVWFAPRDDAMVDWLDFTHQVREGKPWYSSFPWAVTQVSGPHRLGEDRQIAFDSLLLPLRGATMPTIVAETTGWPETRLRITGTDGSVWLLSMHARGELRQVGNVATDAKAVVIVYRPDARPVVAAFETRVVRTAAISLLETDSRQSFCSSLR